mgnify:CR=1 FL=1
MVLNDREIQGLVKSHNLIEGFSKDRLNSFGYDLTLSEDFLVPMFDMSEVIVIDPLAIKPESFKKFKGPICIIPPNSFILGRSVETVNMPRDVTGLCLGRSTYARCGIIANVTPLEAGWRGIVTIEISNSTPLPVKVYANKGIVQVLFFTGNTPDRTYVEKGGRYQNQVDITLPRGL